MIEEQEHTIDKENEPGRTSGTNDDAEKTIDYVRDSNYPKQDNYQWYVMTATYQREALAAEHIRKYGVLVYYPQIKKDELYKTKHGRTKIHTVDASLINGMFFIYTDFDTAESFVRYKLDSEKHLSYLRFTYNKTKLREDGRHIPLVVPANQMNSFIDLFASGIDGVGLVSEEEVHFKSNDIVEITGGEFKGIHGRVARIKDETRVVVTLDNICFAATTFVPKKYLKKLEQ